MGSLEKLTEQELFFLGWNLGHTPKNPGDHRSQWVCVCDAVYSSSFASHLMRHAYKYLREHGRHDLDPRYLEQPTMPAGGSFTPLARTRPKFRRKPTDRRPSTTPPSATPVEKHATTRHTAEERAAFRADRIRAREGDPL